MRNLDLFSARIEVHQHGRVFLRQVILVRNSVDGFLLYPWFGLHQLKVDCFQLVKCSAGCCQPSFEKNIPVCLLCVNLFFCQNFCSPIGFIMLVGRRIHAYLLIIYIKNTRRLLYLLWDLVLVPIFWYVSWMS